MTRESIRALLLDTLHKLAPEADLSSLRGATDLRDELDIDSMDFLKFVVSLHETLGVDVPERDYRSLRTLDDGVEYLAKRLDASG